MKCPIHFGFLPFGTECPHCKRERLVACVCELDKEDRTRDTLECQGASLNHRRSFAVMVFDLPADATLPVPAPSDLRVLDAMEQYGGSFVKALAAVWRMADIENQQRLHATFYEYWNKYVEMAREDAARKAVPR